MGLNSGLDSIPGLLHRERSGAFVKRSATEPLIQSDLTVLIRNMNANGIGIGVQTDQKQINRSTTAEAVFNGFTEVMQTLKS